MRLLWIGDSPFIHTGGGRVTREILTRLSTKRGIDITCVGRFDIREDGAELPFRVVPATGGTLGKHAVFTVLDEWRPEVVIAVGDPWMLRFVEQAKGRDGCRIAGYLSVDGEPWPPEWRALAESFDIVVASSAYGRRVLSAGCTTDRVRAAAKARTGPSSPGTRS